LNISSTYGRHSYLSNAIGDFAKFIAQTYWGLIRPSNNDGSTNFPGTNFSAVGAVTTVSQATKMGSNLALGLGDDLFHFAETKGFDTYKSFSTGFQKDKILNAMNSYDNIHFNVTDFGKYRFSRFDPTAPLTYRNYTNWEMHTIFKNPILLNKTRFYKKVGNEYEIVHNFSPYF
jgi:hypothetical protein